MVAHTFILVLFYAWLPSVLLASVNPLPIDSFIAASKSYHPFYKEKALQERQLLSQLKQTTATQEWQQSISLAATRQEPIQTNTFTPDSQESLALEAGLKKLFWKSGGTLHIYATSAQASVSYGSNTPAFLTNTPRMIEQRAGISYTQPLIKNRGGTLSTFHYAVTQTNNQQQRIAFFQEKERFLLSSIEAYLQWALASAQVSLIEKQLTMSKRSLQDLKKKQRANLIERLDVLRQEEQIRSIQSELVSFKAQRASATTHCSLLSGLPEAHFIAIPATTTTLPRINSPYTLADTTIPALFNSYETRNALKQRHAKQLTRPALDLGLNLSAQSGSDDVSHSLDFDRRDYNVSLVYATPLFNHAGNERVAEFQLQAAVISQQKEHAIKSFQNNSKRLLAQLDSQRKLLQLSKKQQRSAAEKVAEERRLYELGKGNLSIVIAAEQNKHAVDLAYSQHVTSYLLTYYHYLEQCDRLWQQDRGPAL